MRSEPIFKILLYGITKRIMLSTLVETAKNLCVPKEQNELVVIEPDPIPELNIPISKLHTLTELAGKLVYVIGNDEKTIPFIGSLGYSLKVSCIDVLRYSSSDTFPTPNVLTTNVHIIARRTVLDIPIGFRSSGIIICLNKPSYDDHWSLFHLFGGTISGLTEEYYDKKYMNSFQTFSSVIDGIQNDGTSAVVFVPKALQNDTLKSIMWCPMIM